MPDSGNFNWNRQLQHGERPVSSLFCYGVTTGNRKGQSAALWYRSWTLPFLRSCRIPPGKCLEGLNAATDMTNCSLLMGRDRSAQAGFCLGTAPASAIMHLGKDLLLEIFTRVYYFCWILASEWKFLLGGGRRISGKTLKTEKIKDRINWVTTSIFRTKNEKVLILLRGFILNSTCLCTEGRQKAQQHSPKHQLASVGKCRPSEVKNRV